MKGRFAKTLFAAVIIAALISLPRLFSLDYYLHIFVMSEIYAVLALSLSLLVGFTGQVSMGHAAFYGMGAYTSAILSIRLGLSFWLTFWIAGIFAGLAAFIIGKLVLRLRGHVLAITTAFFGVLVAVVMNNWIPVTNGPMGITGIPRPSPFSVLGLNIALESRTDYYFLGLLFVAGVLYFLWRIENSRIGDAMIAVRENEELAASIGIDTMKSKVLAFTIGGGLAGLAGAFYAHYILVMVIFGGMSTLFGPVLGAICLTVLPELLRMAGELRLVIYGAALIFFIIWMPMGVWGTFRDRLVSGKK